VHHDKMKIRGLPQKSAYERKLDILEDTLVLSLDLLAQTGLCVTDIESMELSISIHEQIARLKQRKW